MDPFILFCLALVLPALGISTFSLLIDKSKLKQDVSSLNRQLNKVGAIEQQISKIEKRLPSYEDQDNYLDRLNIELQSDIARVDNFLDKYRETYYQNLSSEEKERYDRFYLKFQKLNSWIEKRNEASSVSALDEAQQEDRIRRYLQEEGK